MTLPVPNLQAPLVNKLGRLIPPWNSWFQQFTQPAPAVVSVTLTGSTFSYQANANGNLIISSGTVSAISLTRGTTTIALSTTRPLIVPISISDIVNITYTVAPTVQFLGA